MIFTIFYFIMKKLGKEVRGISYKKVKDAFRRKGVDMTDNQAIQITEFVYTIAETLLGRDFIDPNEVKRRVKSKKRKR